MNDDYKEIENIKLLIKSDSKNSQRLGIELALNYANMTIDELALFIYNNVNKKEHNIYLTSIYLCNYVLSLYQYNDNINIEKYQTELWELHQPLGGDRVLLYIGHNYENIDKYQLLYIKFVIKLIIGELTVDELNNLNTLEKYKFENE